MNKCILVVSGCCRANSLEVPVDPLIGSPLHRHHTDAVIPKGLKGG